MGGNEKSELKGLVKQHVNQAGRYLKQMKYDKSMEAVNLAIDIGKDLTVSARAYHKRAEILKAQGDLDNAIIDIDMAISINPAHIPLYLTKAQLCIKKQNTQEAINSFLIAFELSKGKDFDSLFQIGSIYYDNKEYDRAIEYYTKSIDAGGTISYIYGKRALAYKNEGKLQEARADEQEANLPDWFFDINPMFYDNVAKILKSKHPELVRYIPPNEKRSPNGTIVFGPNLAERAFDAKTGEFIWMS